MERFTKGGAFKERCNGNIPYAEIISFVSKVEDFMEEQDFESLEDLKNTVEECKKVQSLCSGLNSIPVGKQILIINELINLCICEGNWKRMKEWIVKEQGYVSMHQEERFQTLDEIKDKMEQLERGVNNVKD